jgi:AraC family transcriptional regulator, regulatory protein of adaptative response / DNA-3-methyladenine glycosylase II
VGMNNDFESRYRAVSARDRRFDGIFVTAVTSTGIYCRPSCPAITPKRTNVRFFTTSAGAQAAGFRPCKRCRPDVSPGSPEWNVRADIVARAMRMIDDGVVDREGVGGLARRLHVSERHLHRLLVGEVGASPQALARAHRAQTARVLIETTRMTFSEVAFGAGFTSIRQFNDVIKDVFRSTPTDLRARVRHRAPSPPGRIVLRLPYRAPLNHSELFKFLERRAVPGLEEMNGRKYRRTLRLPHSPAVVELEPVSDHVRCELWLGDERDLAAAVQRCRRLLDLDADPEAIDSVLAGDPVLRPLVRQAPGLRIPGSPDGAELALRAVLGQQISIPAARTIAGRIVASFGKPLTVPDGSLTHVFPAPEVVADADLAKLGIPGARQAAIRRLAAALASGEVALDAGADRSEVRDRLLKLPGIGPWTATYVCIRALGDPDAFMFTDLGVVRALNRLRLKDSVVATVQRWSPWRSYAQQHLWTSLRGGG